MNQSNWNNRTDCIEFADSKARSTWLHRSEYLKDNFLWGEPEQQEKQN